MEEDVEVTKQRLIRWLTSNGHEFHTFVVAKAKWAEKLVVFTADPTIDELLPEAFNTIPVQFVLVNNVMAA